MKHIVYLFIFACSFFFQQHMCAMQEDRLPQRHVERIARVLLLGEDREGLLEFFCRQQEVWRGFRVQDLAMPAISGQLAEQHDLMRVWNSMSESLFFAYVDWVDELKVIAVRKQLGCHYMPLSSAEQDEWGEQMEQVSSDEFGRRLYDQFSRSDLRDLFLDEGERLASVIIRVLDSE